MALNTSLNPYVEIVINSAGLLTFVISDSLGIFKYIFSEIKRFELEVKSTSPAFYLEVIHDKFPNLFMMIQTSDDIFCDFDYLCIK